MLSLGVLIRQALEGGPAPQSGIGCCGEPHSALCPGPQTRGRGPGELPGTGGRARPGNTVAVGRGRALGLSVSEREAARGSTAPGVRCPGRLPAAAANVRTREGSGRAAEDSGRRWSGGKGTEHSDRWPPRAAPGWGPCKALGQLSPKTGGRPGERPSAAFLFSSISPGSRAVTLAAASSFQKKENKNRAPAPRRARRGPAGPRGSVCGSPCLRGPPGGPGDFRLQIWTLSPHRCASETCSHNSKVTCGDSRFVLSS